MRLVLRENPEDLPWVLLQEKPPVQAVLVSVRKRRTSPGEAVRLWHSGVVALEGAGLVVLHLVLVAHHDAVELVHQGIHSGIQVGMGGLDEQIAALDAQAAFRTLALFFFLLLFCFIWKLKSVRKNLARLLF